MRAPARGIGLIIAAVLSIALLAWLPTHSAVVWIVAAPIAIGLILLSSIRFHHRPPAAH